MMTNKLLRDYSSSNVEDIIKSYLEENLWIDSDWIAGGYYPEPDQIIIKLMLGDEQVSKTTAYKP